MLTDRIAVPPDSDPEPSTLLPSLKVTEPVALPPPGLTGFTVAVSVTGWPNTDGLPDDEIVVVVDAAFTVAETAVEVLPPKLPLELKVAVSEWLPPVERDVVKLAVPPERLAVPSTVEPSLNVTLPTGVPVPGATAVTVAERLKV